MSRLSTVIVLPVIALFFQQYFAPASAQPPNNNNQQPVFRNGRNGDYYTYSYPSYGTLSTEYASEYDSEAPTPREQRKRIRRGMGELFQYCIQWPFWSAHLHLPFTPLAPNTLAGWTKFSSPVLHKLTPFATKTGQDSLTDKRATRPLQINRESFQLCGTDSRRGEVNMRQDMHPVAKFAEQVQTGLSHGLLFTIIAWLTRFQIVTW
ncbi:unnamed protein product [Protopolystoma xenopodis]|uniref:Uncharacterized protein n=1 Tax=Protopolystoma xenopodis TaxID=117903 RepID=A0A3S4ZT84_9PLAT|nr:unnamed protein product [Protopolystoma xenopodis]